MRYLIGVRRTPRVSVAAAALALGLASGGQANALPANDGSASVRISQDDPSGSPARTTSSEILDGDTLKIVFYEQLDNDEDKWRGAGGRPAAPRGFHLRAELSGEYQVDETGAISVPMLGRFAVSNLSFETVQSSLNDAFERLIERKGFVNVLSSEHQPVYIVGPVKTPGSFKYRNGMTVLHAVAMAGGLRQTDVEPWQRVDAHRQFESLHKALQRVKQLVLRTEVLKDERSNTDKISPEAVSLVGTRDTKFLQREEELSRSLVAISRRGQETALTMALNDARSELAVRLARVGPFDESIKLRKERVQNIEQLVGRNILNRPVLIQVQGELSELQDRRQQAQIEVEAARQKVTKAELDLEKQKVESRVELDKAVATAEHDGTEAANDSDGLLDVLRTLATSDGLSDGDPSLSYEIVRKTAGATQTLNLSETASLRPGDLVRVKLNSSKPLASR